MFPMHDLLDYGVRDAPRYIVEHSSSERSSWISIPHSVARDLYASGAQLPVACAVTVQLPMGLPPLPPIYLPWAGASCDAGRVAIPARLAMLLDIPEGAEVILRPLLHVPDADAVTVEPASSDDWEILELNAGVLEEQLLSQTGVASPAQPLAVWVNKQLVSLHVTAVTPPSQVVRLVDGTEVHIAPRVRVNGNSVPSPTGDGLGHGTQTATPGGFQMPTAPVPNKMLLRLLEWNDDDVQGQDDDQRDDQEQEDKGGTTPQIAIEDTDGEIGESAFTNSNIEIAGGTKMPKRRRTVYISPMTLERCEIVTGDLIEISSSSRRSILAEIMTQRSVPAGHVGLLGSTLSAIDAREFDTATVRKLGPLEREDALERLAAAEAGGGGAPTGEGGAFAREDGPHSSMGGRPIALRSGSPGSERQLTKKTTRPPASIAASQCSRTALFEALTNVLPVLGAGPRSVMQRWGAPRPGGLLIEGPAGSGKTALCRALGAVLQQHPQCLVAVETVPCRELHSLGEAKERIEGCLGAALSRLPALLVLDDLDVLCPAAGEEGQGHDEGDGGLISYLCDVIDSVSAPDDRWLSQGWTPSPGRAGAGAWPPIVILATCREAASLPPALREAGRFESLVSLESPSAEERAAMLATGIVTRGAVADPAALHAVAVHADGYDGADLGVLLDRAINLAVARQLRGSGSPGGVALRLHAEDLEGAMLGMTPAAFWGAGTRTSVQAGIKGWEDVGGLSEVKQALQEALELPLKYPTLIAQAPLRLRTGVLLYGPPGCGKTHIVAAAVAASGVRCITVSGPELLNKYIGASEAAVRDIFRRASAAAPSVLFFDEFDAIAPARGHDNTGVSDRVVNQLLTELDGVEGLRGVSVVAATSRPDLLDAALLRPGRMDRLLYCGFPSPTERTDVLSALSRRLVMAEDVDLECIAERTEGYSGADLGALLSEAQLAAAHEALEAREGGGIAPKSDSGSTINSKNGVVIASRHLEAAVEAARPSVSENERTRLQEIYRRFVGGGMQGNSSASAGAGAEEKGKGKMVSWA